MPKPKISREEFIYRCKLGIFEDIVVEGLGYVFWTSRMALTIRTIQGSKHRSYELNHTYFLGIDKVAVVLPAYLDSDFETKRKESEDKLLTLFKEHYTDTSGKLDEAKYRKIEKDIKEDMLSLADNTTSIPFDIYHSNELKEYFDYHEGFNSRRLAMGRSVNAYDNSDSGIGSHSESNRSAETSKGNTAEIAGYINNVAGLASTVASTTAGLRYTSNPWGGGFWVGKNGKMYDMSLIANKGKGWNFYQNSANTAKNATKWARGLGNALGYATTLYSTYKFWQNPTLENGFSFAEGVGSLLYWPLGVADAYVHIGTAADVWRFEQIQNISNSKYDTMTQAAMLWGLRRAPY